MRTCPHCGKQILEGNNTIYCPSCNQIVDEEVLLRMRIEKKLQKSDDQPFRGFNTGKEEQEKQKKHYHYDDDYRSIKIQNNEKSYTSTIVSIIVVIAVIAAVYFLLK
ncbi:hypothetical protein [Lacrimispora sp.]|uniref:hypothetical protein n=1 Tax=Lacrimispora sp. TaxID=2719234 RepID=UPI0039E2D90F